MVDSASNPPDSVRERLTEGETRMLFLSGENAGTIAAERRVAHDQWERGVVDLKVNNGEVVATADADGAITIERLTVRLSDIPIPESVFNREAALTNVQAELAAPAVVTTTWIDENTAHMSATLDLAFSWALDGSGLGAPKFPPIAVEFDVTGDGSFVHADVRAGANGELWSWAGLIKLADLQLVLAADTN